jgi:signal transduction histidine kinase
MRGPSSANIKISLLATALLIVIGTLWYTQRVVEQLLQKEREVADLYAKSLEYIANSPSDQADYSFVFDEVLRSIDFPLILSDGEGNPIQPYPSSVRNVSIDTTLSLRAQEEFLRRFIRQLDEQRVPIRVSMQDTILLQVVHYGESTLVTRLRWLPYIVFGIGGMFILVGYVGFSYIKRSEQSNIWVGMAKETAHQLGTPLSSIMGWAELLSLQADDPKKLRDTLSEMENDLNRLEKIVSRFSKIGSKPSLKEEDLHEVIAGVVRYFERRLPQMGKNIDLQILDPVSPRARVNRELFEWVIENLVKNGLDAMESGSGTITIMINKKGKDIIIDVADTGKGIDTRRRKDVFRPGYTTKERGWGLGLSLSKRIIETYHKGKLALKESRPGKGTTFRIRLRG